MGGIVVAVAFEGLITLYSGSYQVYSSSVSAYCAVCAFCASFGSNTFTIYGTLCGTSVSGSQAFYIFLAGNVILRQPVLSPRELLTGL